MSQTYCVLLHKIQEEEWEIEGSEERQRQPGEKAMGATPGGREGRREGMGLGQRLKTGDAWIICPWLWNFWREIGNFISLKDFF